MIASYSGNKIKIILAEDFQKGSELTPEITEAIQSADIFLLLYTGEDQDWGYCLLEAGQFQTALSKDQTRAIVVFHDPGVSKPRALSQYISVPISQEPVYEFLHQLYVERQIYPGIDPSFLHKTANDICREFDYTHVIAINFDLVPNFSVEFDHSKENTELLENESLPAEALFMGTQDWQSLFGKNVSTGAWTWKDLSGDWADNDIYEPELARMLRTANKKRAPQGCFIRPVEIRRSLPPDPSPVRRDRWRHAVEVLFHRGADRYSDFWNSRHDEQGGIDGLQYDKHYLVCAAKIDRSIILGAVVVRKFNAG